MQFEEKTRQFFSEKKTTVINHEELILIYNCVETKQEIMPEAMTLQIHSLFSELFYFLISVKISEKKIIYFVFYTRDISSDFRENDWCCLIP